MTEEKDISASIKQPEESQAYRILSEKLRQELTDTRPDEGEVFSILDLLLFSLESEENSYLGNIGLRVSTSILDALANVDRRFGRGFFRQLKLFWFAPSILEQLIERSTELRNSIGMCANMMTTVKRSQLVHFVERSGGSFHTPVIQKWLDARSLKISMEDWKKLMA
ncbi:MAG: hypothetical protein J5846_09465 [Desulfovibrio sp.]|nr:hypothetical protein [Desulfovibrio sp.]